MTKYIRIINKEELNNIIDLGKIQTSKHLWEPYAENEIVLLFESENMDYTFNKFGSIITELRDMNPGESIYIIEINNPPGKIESDKSALHWPESKAHFGDIPKSSVSVIGESKVIDNKPGNYTVEKVIFYKNPRSL